MRRALLILILFVTPLMGQQKPPDLTGTVSFEVDSRSHRVERIAVQVGDGGTGRYKAILAGDPSLPTHTIYRPRDLRPFGSKVLMPIVAFGNGGCRNGSGEFRNFLSDIASHGYLVIAIGPAGDSVVAGSEGRTGMSQAWQLLDGVEWATKENSREGSEYYRKLDPSKVAMMGQSCGTRQALQMSSDPRVKTTVLLNGGGANLGAGRGRAAGPALGAPPAAVAQPAVNPTPAIRRYAPGAPELQPVPGSTPAASAGDPPTLTSLHGPVAFITGGPTDAAHDGAVAGFEAVQRVPALLAWQDVGHSPATYRHPNGGAFAVAANAWLDWHLKGDQAASKMFVGADCGLCRDPKWHVQFKGTHAE